MELAIILMFVALLVHNFIQHGRVSRLEKRVDALMNQAASARAR